MKLKLLYYILFKKQYSLHLLKRDYYLCRMVIYSCPDFPPYILCYALTNYCFYNCNRFFIESTKNMYGNIFEEKIKYLKRQKKKKEKERFPSWMGSIEEKAAHLTLTEMKFKYLQEPTEEQLKCISRYIRDKLDGYGALSLHVDSGDTTQRIEIEFKIKKNKLVALNDET